MGGLSGERKISFLSGRACSKALRKKGYKVKVIDDLSSGFQESLLNGEELIIGDFGDERLLNNIFKKDRIIFI